MLARTPQTDVYIAQLEPWRIRLRSALGRWEKAHAVPKAGPKSRKLTKDRSRSIREKIVPIMRAVEPTPFAAEGPCRAGIRSSLCLQGWSWQEADDAAALVVAAALHVVGARRPTWYEGQPEWTQPGALPIERERCAFCRGRLPEGHWRFCCRECGQHFHKKRACERIGAERLIRGQAREAAISLKRVAGAAR